jgi:hypothetical protein
LVLLSVCYFHFLPLPLPLPSSSPRQYRPHVPPSAYPLSPATRVRWRRSRVSSTCWSCGGSSCAAAATRLA